MAKPTKKDWIAGELRRLLADGSIERGTRIHQDELAKRFNASITPVREALRELEAEGLLERDARRGIRVATADLDRLKGIYVMRRLVEPYAMARAAYRLSPRDLKTARGLAAELADAAARGDRAAVREANHRFHFFLYDHAGMPSLTRLIEGLWIAFPWDVLDANEERTARAHRGHEAILDAIEARDADAVRAACDEHIAVAYVDLARLVDGTADGEVADPFDIEVD
jgi:DNA-binding GntR family transcriptional regulator